MRPDEAFAKTEVVAEITLELPGELPPNPNRPPLTSGGGALARFSARETRSGIT